MNDIRIDEAVDAAELAVVDAGIDAFNAGAAPLYEVRALARVARRDAEVIGGAVGRTWGSACELQQLWVRADCRGAGLGRRLLTAFEAAAAARGCMMVSLETFDFQAPDFYAAQGYTTVWRNTAYPHGIVKHHMAKALAAPAAVPPPL